MSDLPRALGFVREDYAGSTSDRRQIDIQNYADALKFDLVELLVIPAEDTDARLRLLETIFRLEPDVVIIPAPIYVSAFRAEVTSMAALHTTAGRIWERQPLTIDPIETARR